MFGQLRFIQQALGQAPMYNKGGGGTSTTSGGIDAEFKPYLEKVLKDVTTKYEAEAAAGQPGLEDAYRNLGDTASKLGAEAEAKRAGLTQYETEGAGAAAARQQAESQIGQDWSGMISNDLANSRGGSLAQRAAGGALSSARAERGQEAAMADRAIALRQAENTAKSAAGQNLANLDTAQQSRHLGALGAGTELAKAQYAAGEQGVAAEAGLADAPHRAAQRYFGYLGSGAIPTTQTTTQSGGK